MASRPHQEQVPGHPESKHELHRHLDLIDGADARDDDLHRHVGSRLVLRHRRRLLAVDVLVDDDHLAEPFVGLVGAIR